MNKFALLYFELEKWDNWIERSLKKHKYQDLWTHEGKYMQ